MIAYQKLDAWRVCHQLALNVYKIARSLDDIEPDTAGKLRIAGMQAAAKLARGTGTRNEIMFRQCAEMSAGYLSEVKYLLKLLNENGLITDTEQRELDALRGRAAFYLWKHLFSLPTGPRPDPQRGLDWE